MADKILTFNGKTISGPSGIGIVMIKEPEPVQGVTIGGRTYRTVTIGNQEWMAEYLDYKFNSLTVRDGISGNILDHTQISQAAYFNYDEATYGITGNKYGLLYNWYAMNYLNEHLSDLGIPAGWHVPTKTEWNTLFIACGNRAGAKLITTDISGCTDEFGFTGLPTGSWEGQFYASEMAMGYNIYFMSAENDICVVDIDPPIIGFKDQTVDKTCCFSIRLVKDLS